MRFLLQKSRNNQLIDKPDLKSAMDYCGTTRRREMGLTGADSTHSLRYAWAQGCHSSSLSGAGVQQERGAGQWVAMDLGHGDGRGRYVVQVYG